MCDPGGITFAEFLEQYRFLACSVVISVWVEKFFDGAEEVPRHMSSLVRPSL